MCLKNTKLFKSILTLLLSFVEARTDPYAIPFALRHKYKFVLTPLIPTTPRFIANTFSQPRRYKDRLQRWLNGFFLKKELDWTHSWRWVCERLPPSHWSESEGGSQSPHGSRAADEPVALWLENWNLLRDWLLRIVVPENQNKNNGEKKGKQFVRLMFMR